MVSRIEPKSGAASVGFETAPPSQTCCCSPLGHGGGQASKHYHAAAAFIHSRRPSRARATPTAAGTACRAGPPSAPTRAPTATWSSGRRACLGEAVPRHHDCRRGTRHAPPEPAELLHRVRGIARAVRCSCFALLLSATKIERPRGAPRLKCTAATEMRRACVPQVSGGRQHGAGGGAPHPASGCAGDGGAHVAGAAAAHAHAVRADGACVLRAPHPRAHATDGRVRADLID